jgi:exodeoxyribonuclease V beta subunit
VTLLDPLAIPLRGLHLIEASAGTGKTYTIAGLYLRLLLDGLPVDRILVVTYTNAATEELRGRVRRRLRQALTWLSSASGSDDEICAALPPEDQARARALLGEAVTRMDEAAIYTIHGFCQRVLQDQAFATGVPFEVELLTDEASLRLGVIEDFWRLRVAVMDAGEAAWVCAAWRSPDELLAAISEGLARDDLCLLPEDAQAAAAEEGERRTALFDRMRALWAESGDEVGALLETSPALNRRSYTKPVVKRAVAAMDRLMRAPELPADLGDDVRRLTPERLAAQTKPGQVPPGHPLFDLCGDLLASTERTEAHRRAAFLAAARGYLREQLARRKEDARQLFFDDLLARLDQALAGPRGELLAERLRRSYPVALIDEFQDTDPLQYRIFRRLYLGRPECGLYLIGDPKQAIYAFRGADIFTYIQARRASAQLGARHSLGTNWRSASRLVTAVNRLFGGVPRPFLYAEIPFEAVAPGPAADAAPLVLDEGEVAPLQIWLLPTDAEQAELSQETAAGLAAAACAERIAALLDEGAARRARIGGEPLRARDLAVLVRTHREGAQMQAALRRCGVASVTLSQDSVLSTPEAGELALVLAAVADGADEGLIRGALATGLLGTPVSALVALAADEAAWEALLGRFQGYRERWRGQGFLGAFQALLQGEGVAARLLAAPQGERRLTNLLHLAELLAAAETEHPGPDALLRWLADRRAAPAVASEEEQLRLESDDDLVAIVTMHKSKGLEYPVVFLPFPWTQFSPRGKGPVLFHRPDDLRACLDLGSPDQASNRALAEQESLAQRLRLLYVAVTRAKQLCVLCWGRVKGAERSALAYLLHPDPGAEPPGSRLVRLDDAGLRGDLAGLARDAAGAIAVYDLPASKGTRRARAATPAAELQAARPGRAIPRDWRLASYSWLTTGAEAQWPDHDPGLPSDDTRRGAEAGPVDGIFRFPRGTEAGHFLHALLEGLDFPSAAGGGLQATVLRLLARHGLEPQWEPTLSRWVGLVLDTPLDPGGLRLRDVRAEYRLTELEFHFPLGRIDAAGLRAALAPFEGYRGAADGLGFEPVRGLMKGYIDLVLRHDGRYFLADYKSNHLGDGLEGYGQAGLARAMRAHRYDLQVLIYTLALHLYLGKRLPGYRYTAHFGGAYYLFLRGMRPEQGPGYGVWHDRPPEALIEALAALVAS